MRIDLLRKPQNSKKGMVIKMYICTPEQMKAAEANAVSAGQTYIGLMENAGAACAEEILRRCPEICRGRGLILCGKGNNGGDGFVIARLLADAGAKITVSLLCGAPSGGIAKEELDKLSGREDISVSSAEETDFSAEYDIICDAVFGTGFHGELPENISEIFARLNRSDAVKIAADIPSGADSITGNVSAGTMDLDFTVTFGAVKCGMTIDPAKKHCGEIITAPIGITEECFESIGFVPVIMDDKAAAKAIPPRNERSHKGCFGKLLIVGGSRNMSGAAALNVTGALRSGAGIVRLASVKSVIDRVGSSVYECTFLETRENDSGAISAESLCDILTAAENSTAAAIGSGMTVCDDSEKIVKEMILFCGSRNIPIIIDADGLNCLGSSIDIIRNANCKAVLTPHPKELSRLLGKSFAEVMADRLRAAKELALKTGAVVAAKGFPTYIVSPDGRARASYTGNGGLSRGGSGDVLTGVISGICASNRGERIFESACAGVYIFGLAADIAADKLSMTGMLPSDAAAQLPFAFKIIGKQLSE